MSIYHCTQCGTNYGPKGSCPRCGRIGSRVSEFKMEPTKTFEAEIMAAHPESFPDAGTPAQAAERFERWNLACVLVGERHEKAELVRLVNWLLAYRRFVEGIANEKGEYGRLGYNQPTALALLARTLLEKGKL